MRAVQLVETISATTDIPAPEGRQAAAWTPPLLRIRPNAPVGRAKQPVSLLVPKRPKPQEA